MNEKNVDPGRQAALEEMQGVWKRQYESLDTVKSTAKTIMGYSSLLLGLIGVLQLSGLFSSLSGLYVFLAVTTAVAYIVLVCICVTIINMTVFYGPILSDWKMLDKQLFNKTDNKLLEQRIADYLCAIEKNNEVLKKRVEMLNFAIILFPVIIALLFLMGLAA